MEEYVRGAKFKALGAAIKDTQRRWLEFEEIKPQTVWVSHEQLSDVLRSYDWGRTAVLAHHAQFDGLVLSHHYNVQPCVWLDTLSMARLLLGNHLSVSLDALARHFGLAAKSVPYESFRGKVWEQLSPDVQREVASGACHDVALTWELFSILRKTFPAEEYTVVDTTVRFYTEPILRGDVDLLAKVWCDEDKAKRERLDRLAVSGSDLRSSDKFAELLRAEGVEPETKSGKANAKTGAQKEIYCFAKTDPFMRDLLDHDSERVRALAEGRLGEKSTLLQTRAETLGWMARRGSLPCYLRYCGAHTTRWSGGDGCLAGDTKILVLDIHGAPKYKKIIDVLLTDLVWDGEEFVEHAGVQFSGYRKTVSWDGISGTPEHRVLCGKTWTQLCEALRTNTPIVDCREPSMWEVEAARTRRRKSA